MHLLCYLDYDVMANESSQLEQVVVENGTIKNPIDRNAIFIHENRTHRLHRWHPNELFNSLHHKQ